MKQPQAQTINLPTAFAMAIAAHMVLIVALAFSAPTPEPRKTLDVTFSVNSSNTELPREAKHIAEQNQQASGTVARDTTPTTTEQSPAPGETVQQTLQQQQKAIHASAQQIVTTQATKQHKIADENTQETLDQSQEGLTELERQLVEMRALEARLAQEQQAYAQRPKIHRFTSVAAMAAVDAAYQKQWQEKVESIGNANYPASAIAQGISGDVTLMVSIYKNGSIKTIELVKSSGHRLLDRSAISSVRLASPFSAFPKELAQKADILEIYRTWQFRNNQLRTIDG